MRQQSCSAAVRESVAGHNTQQPRVSLARRGVASSDKPLLTCVIALQCNHSRRTQAHCACASIALHRSLRWWCLMYGCAAHHHYLLMLV